MTTEGRRLGLVAAAAELSVSRKTLQRYRKQGAPFGDDGTVDVEELRAWAKGRLGRGAGRPTDVERLLEDDSELTAADIATLEDDNIALEDADVVELARRGPKKIKVLVAACHLRRQHADAAKVELENDVRRRELVKLEEVKRIWGRQVEIVKGHFAALPGKLAPRFVGRSYEEIHAALEDELTSLLRTFAVEVPA